MSPDGAAPDMSRPDGRPIHRRPVGRRDLEDEPGVPLERTSMAWQRTGLATLAVGVLLMHARHGAVATWWTGVAAVLAGALTITAAAPLRYSGGGRAIAHSREPARPGWALGAAVALATLTLAVAVGLLA